MSPEFRVFLFTAAAMIFAYTVLYPRLPKKTLYTMLVVDIAVFIAILLAVGMVYAGSDIGFSMFFFNAPWWLFATLSAALVEVPLFIWFCKCWNIDLNPPTD